MDVLKILKEINIIIEFENQHGVQSYFQAIIDNLNGNNPQGVGDVKRKLYSAIENSEIANFLNTDLKILDFLDVREYFSVEVLDELEEIFKSDGYLIAGQLQEFIIERASSLQKIQNLKSILENEFQIKEIKEEKYQIVFSFPEKYQDLDELQKATKDIKNFLNQINSQTTSENREDFKISSVNNGCIEFFIECAAFLAENVVEILDHILRIVGTIELFNKGKKAYGKYAKDRKEKMDKLSSDQLEEDKRNILDELIERLHIKQAEDQVKTIKLVKEILKHFEQGVNIEVKTPFLEKPEEVTEADDGEIVTQKRQSLDSYKTRERINQTNREMLRIQREGIKLELPDGEEQNSKNNTP